jgi:hypothetical protein
MRKKSEEKANHKKEKELQKKKQRSKKQENGIGLPSFICLAKEELKDGMKFYD